MSHPGSALNRLDIMVVAADIDLGEDGPPALQLNIDDKPLADLVCDFERSRRYEPTDSYGPLTPGADLALGPYFMGEPGPNWNRVGHAILLACDCGESACWPLLARITVKDTVVVWSEFEQPNRPDRDYLEFGPFTFDRARYELAVAKAVADLTGKVGAARPSRWRWPTRLKRGE